MPFCFRVPALINCTHRFAGVSVHVEHPALAGFGAEILGKQINSADTRSRVLRFTLFRFTTTRYRIWRTHLAALAASWLCAIKRLRWQTAFCARRILRPPRSTAVACLRVRFRNWHCLLYF